MRSGKILILILLILGHTPTWAQERSGNFDYYVLSLSWSPNWCAQGDRASSAEQCTKKLGWILHGLWPQYEKGWPSKCNSIHTPPSRRMSRDMADIMGSAGLAWHEWRTHGTCSGLSPAQYFDTSRAAFEQFKRPKVFRRLEAEVDLSPKVVEAAFIRDNPQLRPDMITVTCKSQALGDVRICLDKTLKPRVCGADVINDCNRKGAKFHPIP